MPDRKALEYHWRQCVLANVLAAFPFNRSSVSSFPGGGGPPTIPSGPEGRGPDDSPEEREPSKKRPRDEEGASTEPAEEGGPSKRAISGPPRELEDLLDQKLGQPSQDQVIDVPKLRAELWMEYWMEWRKRMAEDS
ncbi:MAG: hypothetical protein M1816_007547 [Peltula sp. TS41687]|nr:MAG: hypothetical protein M1816_007547 [Peltula sp. TS41687]